MDDPPTRTVRPPPLRRQRPRVVAGRAARAGAAVLLVAAAGFLATRPLGTPSSGPEPGGATSSGRPSVGIEVGQLAPDFVGGVGADDVSMVDLDGVPVRLSDFSGHPLWIVFWATWCVPCQEEAGEIRAAYHDHAPDGLAVLAIDVQEPTIAVRDYAAAHGLDYRIGLDQAAAVKALYGGLGLPVHVFIDGSGVIRDRSVGQLTAPAMEEHLAAILPP